MKLSNSLLLLAKIGIEQCESKWRMVDQLNSFKLEADVYKRKYFIYFFNVYLIKNIKLLLYVRFVGFN